jgi:CRISPR-associated endonuclease/helicase Cas3
VQLLETLFGAGTRGARRMHQLANSVIVFDEIQTLPISCVHMFCNAINYLVDHCGSSTVLCTATQPLLNKVDPGKGALRFDLTNEMMPDVSRLFQDLKRVEIIDKRKPCGWTENEIANLAIKEMQTLGSCLVIVNTKASSKIVYEQCKKGIAELVFHLNTNMCPVHRKKILSTIKEALDSKDGLQVLCVSTQLIEAGVDIDFGAVIRFVAGMDSIAQAAGRCNRNGLRELGRVYIINPSNEKIDRLIDIKKGKDSTERLLGEFMESPAALGGNLLSEQVMDRYFKYYFFDRRHDMDYPVKLEREDSLLNMLALNTMAVSDMPNQPELYFRQSFMSAAKAFKAINAPTEGVIVPYDEGNNIIAALAGSFDTSKEIELLRKAQQYTVSVFSNVMEKLQKQQAVHEVQEGTCIMYLDREYYSQEFGLSEEPCQAMEMMHV